MVLMVPCSQSLVLSVPYDGAGFSHMLLIAPIVCPRAVGRVL